MQWFKNRLVEPSTWAGFAALIPAVISLASHPLTPDAVGAFAAGVAAIFLREGKSA